jgi:hypothetical protein
MRTTDIFVTTAKKLNESIEKVFGKKLNLESFDLEQLQDARNKLRTQVSQARGAGGFNENLENDAYTQAQWMLDAINAEIMQRGTIANEAEDQGSPYEEEPSNDPHADPDPSEYDREGEMAKGQLSTGEEAAEELRSILASNEDLPEWVQAKITLAVDYLDTARDYMKGQHEKGVEPTEDINTNEAYINNAKDAVDLLANLRKQSKMAELGQGDPVRPNQLVNDLWDVMQWIEHNMKESIGEGMSNLREGEIQQASAIVTAKTMVDRVGRWIEELSGMENDTLLTLGDSIRDEMGAEQAKNFISACAPAIQQALQNLKDTREALSTSVRALTGEEQGAEMLGGEPAGDETGDDMFGGEAEPDAMNPADDIGAEEPVDDFAAAEPAAGGLGDAGREKRESIDRSNQLLKVLAG